MTEDHIIMDPIPSTEYEGYGQDTLNKIAGAVILRAEYQEIYDIYINNDDLQNVIWGIVCPPEICPSRVSTNPTLNIHLARSANSPGYYQYVMDHYTDVIGNYVMTIWQSRNSDYQDILEAKLVEKHGVPNVEKKVMDTNDSTNETQMWMDSADYDIGDSVPFQITATLRDIPKFKSYYLKFEDEMQHFNLNEESIHVTLDGVDVTNYFAIEVTHDNERDITHLNIECNNILELGAHSNSQVVVTYDAILNDHANLNDVGNPNKVHLVYTRSSGTADKGVTPDDLVIVFTYQLVVNKTDETYQPLSNANFSLSKLENGSYKELTLITNPDDDTVFTWKGLDDGTYMLKEIETPAGYNTMAPIVFTIQASHDTNSEHPHLRYFISDYSGFYGFATYNDWAAYEATSYLPNVEGYLSPIVSDPITAYIINQSGTTLPSTGGMGTKLIYSLGAIMVLASGVLLVSKKRMK